MQWLTAMFKNLRKSSVKIQVAIRKFLSRKHIMDQRLADYIDEEGSMLFDLQELEHACIVEFAGGVKDPTKGVACDGHSGFTLSAIPDKTAFATH